PLLRRLGAARALVDRAGAAALGCDGGGGSAAAELGVRARGLRAVGLARRAPPRATPRRGRLRPRAPDARAQPPHPRALRAARRGARRSGGRRGRFARRVRARATRSESRSRLPPGRRALRAVDALPRTRRPIAPRGVGERATLRPPGRAGVRGAPRARVRVPPPRAPAGRRIAAALGLGRRRPGEAARTGRAPAPPARPPSPVGDGGHGHYDALSIEVAANGRPLIVDPGRYTYAVGEPDLRHRFKSTAAHTTVTVDGRDQTPYSRGRPKGPVAAARAGMRTRTARLDVLRGEARSPSYEAVHARTILFVDDAWWLVQDRLTGEITHEYDLRFQLASPDAYVVGSRVVAPGLVLEIAGSDGITLETGWVAPSYGVRLPTAVVSARHSGRDALFTTIVAPVHATHVAPRLASWDVGRADVVVGGRTETFAWTELA